MLTQFGARVAMGTNNKVYLVRKNLNTNTSDSIFLKQSNTYGVTFSKIMKFGDTTAIQITDQDSMNLTTRPYVNSYYLVYNNAVKTTITKTSPILNSLPLANLLFDG